MGYSRKWLFIDAPKRYDVKLLQFGFQECEPGYFFGPATRDYYVIHYVESGKGEYTYNNTTYAVSANQCFMLLPGISTFYVADQAEPWNYYWLGIEGEDAAELVNALVDASGGRLIFDVGNGEALASAINRMITRTNEINNGGAVYTKSSHFLQAYTHLVFDMLLSRSQEKAGFAKNDAIAEVVSYIEKNYKEEIKLALLCKTIGIDRTQLFRIFKKEYGVSPQEFLINYRLNRSVALMKETNASLGKVALESGFKNYSHFSKTFKVKFGKTPNEFQKEYR